jgi:hypothetical protein
MAEEEDLPVRYLGATTEVFPPAALAWWFVASGVMGAVFLLCLMIKSLGDENPGGVVAGALGAAFYCSAGVWAWRRRKRPLRIEMKGAIWYGGWKICEASQVRRVVYRSDGDGNYDLWFELAHERAIRLPRFFSFISKREAGTYARRLGKILKATVSENFSSPNVN